MPTNLRRLGVYGESNPTKKSGLVTAADFNIGSIIGLFERRYKTAKVCNNITEFQEIFGNHITSTYYGWDAVKGFFDNSVGTAAKLYVVGHVGYDGTIYDGVSATVSLNDTGPVATLKLESAYKNELEYSASGNRTGYTVTNGNRFTTDIATASLAGDTFIYPTSVAGMVVGDIIKVVSTGGGGATVYKKITAIDETLGKVSFVGAFDGAAFPQANDVVTIPGFQLQLYRKSINGIEAKVEEGLGKIWCTMEDEVTDFFVENVFNQSSWIKCTDLDSAGALGTTFPADVTSVTYLTSGADGTAPTTAAHYSQDLLALDDLPVRFIANPESTTEAVQKAIETYSRARILGDYPKVIYNIAEDQTKTQLITIGNAFQRSDDVAGVIVGDWLEVTDPFATSINAPNRNIPNVGHVMGAWIRSIADLGIHFIPSTKATPLFGINDIVRETTFDMDEITEVAESGVNVIQFVDGSGFIIKNFFTPSTTQEFQFANGILMRDFIKVSAVDSLQTSENTPNSFNRILRDKDAILNFMLNLWFRGSTGNVVEGETFGQSLNTDGSPTVWTDHFEVQADLINNPQSSINAGERNLDIWFTYPAPAGSIKIGVGLLLRS
jgi:hypothetical protein